MASSRAEKDSSVEEKLKQALVEETDRRYKFSEKLHSLVSERNQQDTVREEQPTVTELTRRLELVETTINAQLQDLCPSESQAISRRDRGAQDASQERDSGYSPSPATSADMDSSRRQAVLLRASTVDSLMPPEPPATQTALPELLDAPYLSNPAYPGLGHTAGEPTEHSDVASQGDTS